MDESTVRALLEGYIRPDNSLEDGFTPDADNGISWVPSDNTIVLDGVFEAQDLEAIAWWMRNK